VKAEVKKIDSTKREINIEVSGEIVKNKFEDVFQRIAKEAKVPGFRPGHAPRDILEKHFASNAHEQVLKELVPDLYNEAIKKEELDVIELPEVTDVKLDRNSLSFKATVEVSPQINIKDYKGLKVNYKNISVNPDEVKRNIDSLKEARSINAIDDSFAKGLGYPNLAELGKAIERQIFLNKENQERSRIENELIENLTKDLDFKIPQSLVKRQLQDLVRQTKVDLALRGVAREKIDEQEEALFKELEGQATKQVKVYLVLTEIAKKENIPQDDSMPRRVMEFLLKEANWVETTNITN
jgi:FKBP-type peptidyl-prolyl cis-trans isomerase (trigger factor)